MVNDTEHLVITDTFVGVCCTSLKKICGILKRHCLGGGEPAPRTSRNTEYDNLVMPCYRRFPSNAEACANITRRDWNPPLEVVRRWAELCFPEGWSHRGLTRLLCLAPLSFQQYGGPLEALRLYTASVSLQL